MENNTHTHTSQEDNLRLRLYADRTLRIIDFTLDDARLKTRCPLDNDHQYSTQSQYSAGRLDMLPPEITISILLALDVPTLTTFRRVNRWAMGLVNSLHPYTMVLKHCPNVLRAIISINADSFDCHALYRVLRSQKCETCNRFGSYLYLITCRRVCYFCFTSHVDYLPVTVAYAMKYTELSKQELVRMPSVSSLPGRYTPFAKLSKERFLLFDRQAVLSRAPDASIQYDRRIQQQDRKTNETRRYASIISAPSLGPSGQSADWGYYCIGCREDKEPATHFRIKYTTDDILDHLERHHG